MKKVIITGCGGFIGKTLTKYLLNKGICVIGIDVNDKNLKDIDDANFKYIEASFEKYNELESLVLDRDIDVFYHFAWQGVFGAAFKDYTMQLKNTNYAVLAMEKAIAIGCKKFVLAGTVNQYETQDYIGKSDIEPRYTCIYSTAKIAAEMMCKTVAYNNNIEFCSGLIAMAYGENNYSMTIPNVVMNALNNNQPPKLIEGNNIYDLIYVKDIANAFYNIGKSGKNLKTYYVGHKIEDLCTFKEWMLKIRDIINPNMDMKFGEFKDTTAFNYEIIDTHALYDDTEFKMETDFTKSIVQTSNWLKSIEGVN